MANGLGTVAFSRFSDVYIPSVENELVTSNGPLLKKIKNQLRFSNWLIRLGLSSHNQVATIIFTEPPGGQVLKLLKQQGFNVVNLPENPYLQK
jgi:hypothetical protein